MLKLTRVQRVLMVFAGGVLLVSAGCGAEDDGQVEATTVSRSSIAPGAAVPAPSADEQVVAIRGKGVQPNIDDRLALDLATIESLKVVDVEIDDPWEKKKVTYRGVLMSDLLGLVEPGATNVTMTALDDYEVTIPVADLESGHVLLATRADDETLAVEDGGPTRIVFLPQSDLGRNKDMWIWSVKEMVFE